MSLRKEESMTWQEELASLMADSIIGSEADDATPGPSFSEGNAADLNRRAVREGFCRLEDGLATEESMRDQLKGFLKASAEMMLDFGRGCSDILQQSLAGVEDSCVAKKLRGPLAVASRRLRFLNDYLPEDRDPKHSWLVILFVFLIAIPALNVNSGQMAPKQLPKKLYVPPPSASLINLPDGRSLAYLEQGVPLGRARFTMIIPHPFLSSRLAGMPGIKESLLEDFGVRLITYDLPGFGESDPHPTRNLNSSAHDMMHLADALGVMDKFWVMGFSSGGMHAWAAARYFPDQLAGMALLGPMINPYDAKMTKEERNNIWDKWTAKRKFMFILARRFSSLLPYFYRQSFLSGMHGRFEEWLPSSLGTKDKALTESHIFQDFLERDVAESVRQNSPKPFVEEAVLQVSDWGFSLADLQARKKLEGKNIFLWLKSFYTHSEGERTGFPGPIHIWQGMDDQIVPSTMSEFTRRLIPGAAVHRLLGEGHFSYLYFCDTCHRQIFSTLFGSPQGPLTSLFLEDEQLCEDEDDDLTENSTQME